MLCPRLLVTPFRVVAGVRAAPSMGDHQARRTMLPVMVMNRIRPGKKVDHQPPAAPAEFL